MYWTRQFRVPISPYTINHNHRNTVHGFIRAVYVPSSFSSRKLSKRTSLIKQNGAFFIEWLLCSIFLYAPFRRWRRLDLIYRTDDYVVFTKASSFREGGRHLFSIQRGLQSHLSFLVLDHFQRSFRFVNHTTQSNVDHFVWHAVRASWSSSFMRRILF